MTRARRELIDSAVFFDFLGGMAVSMRRKFGGEFAVGECRRVRAIWAM
jgi:hypothetical protein